MRNLVIAAAFAAGGYFFLLARKRSGVGVAPPTPAKLLKPRQYHDRLANRLEVALSHANRPLWEETCEECRHVGREDLIAHMREQWPEWAERIDRV